MGDEGSGTFFSIKPKMLIIMIIYISLAYCCCYAFASSTNYNNAEEGLHLYSTPTTQVTVNTSNQPTEEEEAQSQGIDLGIFTALGGGLISIGALIYGRATGQTVGIFKILSVLFPATAGIGFITGYGLYKAGIDLPIDEAIDLIMMFIGHIYNLILMLIEFISFGWVDVYPSIPTVPFPFNIVAFVMTFPVLIIILVWLAGLIIEGLKALYKVPLSG